jgi:hypothetical protein
MEDVDLETHSRMTRRRRHSQDGVWEGGDRVTCKMAQGVDYRLGD